MSEKEAEPFQTVPLSQRHRHCQVPLKGKVLYSQRLPLRSVRGQTPGKSYSLLWAALRCIQLAINMDFSFKTNLKAIRFPNFTGTTHTGSGTVCADQLLRRQPLPWSTNGNISVFCILQFAVWCSASSSAWVTLCLSLSSFLAIYTKERQCRDRAQGSAYRQRRKKELSGLVSRR